jgi:hypothetical protein
MNSVTVLMTSHNTEGVGQHRRGRGAQGQSETVSASPPVRNASSAHGFFRHSFVLFRVYICSLKGTAAGADHGFCQPNHGFCQPTAPPVFIHDGSLKAEARAAQRAEDARRAAGCVCLSARIHPSINQSNQHLSLSLSHTHTHTHTSPSPSPSPSLSFHFLLVCVYLCCCVFYGVFILSHNACMQG